jgi:rhamnosyltransferase subunit B
MNLLLLTIGSHGDVHPFIGLGRALAGRGHRVTLAAGPQFEALVRGAGLAFEPLGTIELYDRIIHDPRLWHPTRAFRFLAEQGLAPLMRPAYEIVRKHACGEHVCGEHACGEHANRDEPTVVVAHGIVFGARLAQEKLGIKLVTVHLAPAVFRSALAPPVLSGFRLPPGLPAGCKRALFRLADWVYLDRILAPPINALRAELGLAPVKGILKDWWHSPERVLALFPAWFAEPQADWPRRTRLTGFPLYDEAEERPLEQELRRFLEAGPPPILVTPGSANVHAQTFCQESIRVCQRLGQRGLLLSRYGENVPAALPPAVRWFPYAPFSAVLPRAAAFVHHGGIGTTAQALAAGVPQLIVPLSHDQFDNAARAQRLGTARCLPARQYRAIAAAARLKALLASPAVAQACRHAARQIQADHPLAAACAQIEALAEPEAAVHE